jgi:serpin B
VLTDALYLKAAWAREFPRDRTTREPFTRADGSTVTVPMMHNDPHQEPEFDLGYAEGPGCQVVALPYRGRQAGVHRDRARDRRRPARQGIAVLLDEVQPAPVALAMPRFTAGSDMDLTETLKAAGMPTAFSPDADFSGITDDAALRLDSLQHKTFVHVDEMGTEAAAATGADAQAVSARATHTVTVDRPLLFVITDTATGAPLFLGKITDPTVGP